MFHLSLILSFSLAILTMTMANPCPCELIVNESLPPTSIIGPTNNDLLDDKIFEEYLDRLRTGPQLETSAEIPSLYPLLRQTKSLDISRPRSKRPSWAAVGKRAASFFNKQPSWAQVG
jgi:hypothetical protein